MRLVKTIAPPLNELTGRNEYGPMFVLADHCKNTQGFRKCLIFSEFDFLPG